MNDSLIVDTNLLVLLSVGQTSTAIIGKHKKTTAFTTADYHLLERLVDGSSIIILPNIATEVSNLLAYHAEPERSRVLSTFKSLIQTAEESTIATRTAMGDPDFLRLGVTDCAILNAAAGSTILTSDAVLCVSALKRGLKAINFYHVREGERPGL